MVTHKSGMRHFSASKSIWWFNKLNCVCGLYTICVALCYAPPFITQSPSPYFISIWTFKKCVRRYFTPLCIVNMHVLWLKNLLCYQMIFSLMAVVYWFYPRSQVISWLWYSLCSLFPPDFASWRTFFVLLCFILHPLRCCVLPCRHPLNCCILLWVFFSDVTEGVGVGGC